MKKKKTVKCSILVLAILLGAFLTACSTSAENKSNALKIAIVCSSAGQNDNGYNQSAVNGAKRVSEELGVEYKIIEPTTGIPNALETLAEDGYDLIFNLEYDFEALIRGTGGAKPIAEQYPDTTFIVMNDDPNRDENGNPIHKNVISVLFDVHEASFVAGALTALVTEQAEVLFDSTQYDFTPPDNGKRAVGFIGGTNSNGITVFSYGYIEGLNYIAEKEDVLYNYYAKYDAGFTDSSAGSTIAGTYYNQGANVVFAVAGSVGDGVAAKAKEVQKLAIQVDADKDDQQPGYILTSVIKNTEVPVYEITRRATEGTLGEMEQVQNYSLASGAASITDLSEIEKHIVDTGKPAWENIKKEIEDIVAKIGSGTIKVTNAQKGEEWSAESCPHIIIQ